ncbi:hypothetical protein COLO4_12745 [Corchorus olitorius]|uniref:Uncharacterized protein n=1 Tax=Corchorus olitorius TaxID=93759 RepID=A0A1R3K009_9ROSI|nr:hypothetical protein COLO4_12745 [Corchorus olitorius]
MKASNNAENPGDPPPLIGSGFGLYCNGAGGGFRPFTISFFLFLQSKVTNATPHHALDPRPLRLAEWDTNHRAGFFMSRR